MSSHKLVDETRALWRICKESPDKLHQLLHLEVDERALVEQIANIC